MGIFSPTMRTLNYSSLSFRPVSRICHLTALAGADHQLIAWPWSWFCCIVQGFVLRRPGSLDQAYLV